MKFKYLIILVLSAFLLPAKAQTGFPFDKDVRHFKRLDSLNSPKPGGILFIGSSSITLWDDLEERFKDKPIIKRGLGGSQLTHWVQYYMPYVVYPYQPKKIFIYAGENDLGMGRTPQQVADDFKKFWEMVNAKLPNTKIYYLTMKPSPLRHKLINDVNLGNSLIKAFIDTKPNTKYIDVASILLKKETMFPDSSLFKPDYLHLNSKGYDRWQKVLKKHVK
ncbi:hypothetical protein DJ568_13195 [Mucilaginibacter hurinus]|uniref:SGNH hydrolase-type esterase domain-containing protein n=1 Tax=Mucilaginibacter hurinus TaxID=2201324 RepID=A0A367GLB2_9SPHI|nr:GDSL-type esterase/lipase family protein [Mucilaginibacter hurinus]RCH54249.1 hypothetical protein DJ568_13195 [Mucilaginibacter hurinus]